MGIKSIFWLDRSTSASSSAQILARVAAGWRAVRVFAFVAIVETHTTVTGSTAVLVPRSSVWIYHSVWLTGTMGMRTPMRIPTHTWMSGQTQARILISFITAAQTYFMPLKDSLSLPATLWQY